jgi:ABC-type Fe3+ transport system permease subunit
MKYLTIILYLIGTSVNSFKLPSVTLDTDINNVHDQFTDSIVNSTVTSINLSIIHVASEVILLILIVYSYKRLSGLILELSIQLVNTRRMVKNACKNQSSEDEVES